MKLRSLVRALRPRQWLKNVLVFAAPLAAGSLLEGDSLLTSLAAFGLFCLASSAIYLVNDVLDRHEDAQHPVKRNRPIASGALTVEVAVGVAVLLAGVVLALSPLVGGWGFAGVVATYLAVHLAYCVRLKHVPVIDLAAVSSGFLLRAAAGGVAVGLVLSPWFMLVASFGSLFMVAGKRFSEVRLMGEGNATSRRSLEEYSASYLRFVWGIAATSAIVFYALWAVSLERDLPLIAQISIAPFALAILRYAVDIDNGTAGEPESVVLGDRVLQALGLLWVLLFGASALLG
ncbi:decaprenyl-phosphate phosphoribosyltransferase [Actinotalea sp. K2]|uniref:decaprenyl-phosphate phosphoribosyltransferase n=1 Tax=Actinotalea sp. K2 TaxID=2939438 RepID=UPI0020173510|nr:decaprenyl-phosphate phosphoribosyltransferase [Actinotalea sp. K2]MCL3862731.1 decaprenyl-phosphate phosphoribosyltransferase [Actinotalea sp. K2]